MRLAIFGSPVAHSLSPAMHQAALEHIGEDGGYEARDVDQAGLFDGIADLRKGLLTGANVTMPHKVIAYEVCDDVTNRATTVGAVNTLLMRGDDLVGDNTDVEGVRSAWELRQLPPSQPVVILGAGGAAAAALMALRGQDLHVVARRPAVAHLMVDRVGARADVLAWGEPVPAGVIVNATSLGMQGEMLPKFLLDSATGLFDMPYGDVETRSVRVARDRGLPVADGLDMLVGQAIGSFAAWTGVRLDATIFRAAAEAELAGRAK